MTQAYLQRWLNAANHYRMQLLGDAADNPDQRIAEDMKSFIDYALQISTGVLSSIVTLLFVRRYLVDPFRASTAASVRCATSQSPAIWSGPP